MRNRPSLLQSRSRRRQADEGTQAPGGGIRQYWAEGRHGGKRDRAELLPAAIGVIGELFAAYETMPFGLDLAEFTDYAQRQFASRVQRIERARAGAPAS